MQFKAESLSLIMFKIAKMRTHDKLGVLVITLECIKHQKMISYHKRTQMSPFLPKWNSLHLGFVNIIEYWWCQSVSNYARKGTGASQSCEFWRCSWSCICYLEPINGTTNFLGKSWLQLISLASDQIESKTIPNIIPFPKSAQCSARKLVWAYAYGEHNKPSFILVTSLQCHGTRRLSLSCLGQCNPIMYHFES